jgi:hypothetical protein
MSHRTVRHLLLLAATCAAALIFPTAGMARSHGDRNGDRIPDRWERAHHLSLKVDQAKRDQDHDGLRNRAEFMAGDDPRDADSDDDGTKDGQEKAGQVVSFTGGVLTVHLFNGDDVKGTVDDDTEIECEDRPAMAPMGRAADEGPGGGDDEGDDDHGDRDHNDGRHHDEGDDEDEDGCDASDLTPGAIVGEAELETTAAGLVFREIELVG